MSRQEDALQALQAAVDDLVAEVRRCPDDQWYAVVPNGWTRAAVAMHCASGNDVGTAWLAYLVIGRDILDDAEFHNRMNGRVADRTRGATKEDTLAALDRSTERARRYVLGLTDEELDRPAHFGLTGRDMTAGQFLANFGRHVRAHTEQFKEGL